MLIILLIICIFVVENNVAPILDSGFNIALLTTNDEDVDWSKYSEQKVTLKESYKITKAGVYRLSGTIKDGNVTVDVKGNVKMILDNVSITSSNSPAIYIDDCDVCVIESKANSKNTLEDSEVYSSLYPDVDGVIFSHDDLYLQGAGTIIIKANHGDGIVSKDNLKINSGTYKITSKDDGIRGTDSVYILDGNFKINASGDGIKSTKEGDFTKGFIYILDGSYDITSVLDGLQAVTKLFIDGGSFTITTGGGSSTTTNSMRKSVIKNSAKGIKCDNIIHIRGGSYTLDTLDDAIHSNDYVEIRNGKISISSGDDGIHADTELIIDNGTINITKSYEGLESSKINIYGGDISVVAFDDGINVSGGRSSSPGMSVGNHILNIKGGNIYVNAAGDGLDCNGSIYMYGGSVVVEGPTDNGNGSLDYDREFIVDGGSLISIGSQGMLQGISNNSKQPNVIAYLDSTPTPAGSVISVVNSEGSELFHLNPVKVFSSIVLSSDQFEMDKTYTIYVGGNVYQTFTITATTTVIGTRTSSGPGGMPSSSRR